MKSRVFLSCGQCPNEKAVAGSLERLLKRKGYDVYVAINAQTLLEINAGIILELKNSDCYLFVNFRREQIGEAYRGSLFSNQELAIAYALGFDRILVVNQNGVQPEGMLRYIGINTETFEALENCCPVVERALDRSGWTPDYARRLRAANLRFSDENLRFADLVGRFLYLDIQNGRPDIAALETTARLCELGQPKTPSQPSPIRSPLKATARPGFFHTIFPNSHEAFDLLCVGDRITQQAMPQPATTGAVAGPLSLFRDPGVHLNSALDVVGAGRLPINSGVWQLRYEFYAIGFPVLSVIVELNVRDWGTPKARILSQEASSSQPSHSGTTAAAGARRRR
jgi:hypothetical protein